VPGLSCQYNLVTVAVQYQIEGHTSAGISASIEAGVRDGELAAGAQLPPVRDLASQLGVAAGTVAAAYQALRQRGVIETAGRNGTRVRSRPAVAQTRLERRPPVPPRGFWIYPPVEPDPRLLPDPWPHLRSLAGQLAGTPAGTAGYRDGGVLPELTAAARQRLAADGIEPPAVTVTSGALDGVDRLLAAHLRPGDRVGVEDPGWANLLDLVAAQGLTPVPVPVDDEGPTPDGLRKALKLGLGALVVTSRAQNPTGAAVSAGRAAALRDLLAGTDVLVIEDDHAAELAYEPLYQLAGATDRWAFLRSAAKPYGPDPATGDPGRGRGDRRAGAGPAADRRRLGLHRAAASGPGAVVGSAVATLVDRARGSYRDPAHRTARRAGRPGRTGARADWDHVWVPVPDETLAVARLRDDGYAVAPGALYRLGTGPGVRVTVAPLDLPGVDAPRRRPGPRDRRRGYPRLLDVSTDGPAGRREVNRRPGGLRRCREIGARGAAARPGRPAMMRT